MVGSRRGHRDAPLIPSAFADLRAPHREISVMRSGSSPASVAPRQIVGAPSHLHARLRSTASGLTLATAALACAVEPARAACTPTLTPTTGQTVTCDSSQPNPVTTGVVAQPAAPT
jgi:hypothetical protein